jgi:toxin ParE1/3/4
VKIVWTDRARRHLRAIHDFIAQYSPQNATRMVDRITQKSKLLGRFPRSGHVVPEYESESVRQILEGNYRIIRPVMPDRIEVVAVIHGARELPPLDSLN